MIVIFYLSKVKYLYKELKNNYKKVELNLILSPIFIFKGYLLIYLFAYLSNLINLTFAI